MVQIHFTSFSSQLAWLKPVESMKKILSRVVTCIEIHNYRQNGGRERKKVKINYQLQIFDGKTVPEHCCKIAFAQSVSKVDIEDHWIKEG